MQANGAEMLRLACCLGTERGIEICAPVHDAMLIAAPLSELNEAVAAMCEAMREASRVVLAGFELGTDVKLVKHPDRYEDPRGGVMWERVMRLIENVAPKRQHVAAEKHNVAADCNAMLRRWPPVRYYLCLIYWSILYS